MMFEEAADLARKSNVSRLVLTHFSPSLPEPETETESARAIFPKTDIAFDGMMIEINFDPR